MAMLREQNITHAMPDHWLAVSSVLNAPVTSVTPSVVIKSAKSTLGEGGLRVTAVVISTTKIG